MSPPVHVLHVSKTGGSAVKEVLLPIARRHGLVVHGHWKSLREVPEGERAVFFLREPASRFVSAFNSRLRRGRPKFDNEWTEPERAAFARFATPNALAEALSADDDGERRLARDAMGAIGHVNLPLSVWLDSPEYLAERRDAIAFVGFQERLTEDFEILKRLLGLPPDLALPTDPVVAHATPAGFETSLSATARHNLTEWYARDVAIYEYLRRSHPRS
jgi:hypothetical protein